MKVISGHAGIVLLTVAFAASCVLSPASVMGKQRTAQSDKAKLALAGQAADRFMRRFYETLDFGVPFSEEFVAEHPLREQGFEPFGDPFLDKLIGNGAAEKMYVSFMNVWFTRLAYSFIHGGKLPPELEDAGGGELFPGGDFKIDDKDTPETLKSRLESYIAKNDQLANMFRKGLPRGEAAYKARLNKLKEEVLKNTNARSIPNAGRVERGIKALGLSKTIPIYVVSREEGSFYYIEKNGVLKVIYINVLGDFKIPFL